MTKRWSTYKSFLQKRGGFLFLTLLILISLLYSLLWLALGILLITLLYVALLKATQRFIKNTQIQLILRRSIQFLFILICSICIRLFVFVVYIIPSKSMENTLFSGDVILVNKLSYGPTIPKSASEIPWIGLLFSGSEKSSNPQQRWSGIGDIQRGDVVVFKRSKGKFAVKRCIGIAGDGFQIDEGVIYVNGRVYQESQDTKKRYQIQVSSPETFYQEVKTLPFEAKTNPTRDKEATFEMHLTKEELSQVQALTSVKNIHILSEESYQRYVGYIEYYNDWNAINLGPVAIPKKGMKVRWKSTTFQLYKKILEEHENVLVTQKGNQFYIDGKLSSGYTFQKDYLFLMGDNRRNSQDSRHYGFVPQEQVVGKVTHVVYSNHDNTFQWDRLFKKVPENQQGK